MKENKLINSMLAIVIVIFCAAFIWTVNTVVNSNNNQIPTAISAFSA